MADWLAVEDLLTLGLGFDIAGAALVARGLLVSPGDSRQTGRTYGWFNAQIANVISRNATGPLADDDLAIEPGGP